MGNEAFVLVEQLCLTSEFNWKTRHHITHLPLCTETSLEGVLFFFLTIYFLRLFNISQGYLYHQILNYIN